MHMTTCTPLANDIAMERVHYFPRQLMTADDMRQEQTYFRDKLRRHNRLLHGWGVVCGAMVKAGKEDCEAVVDSGYILGPYGDEIIIPEAVTVDVCKESLDGNAVQACGESLDPWCTNVHVDRPAGTTLYLAVRYAECQTRPVRVASGGCGCDLTECEYSRIRDSYAIKILASLPSTYPEVMPQPDAELLTHCGPNKEQAGRPCPPCPTEPWVVLADLTMLAGGKIGTIDCFKHRRHVVTLAEYYYLCTDAKP